MTDYYRAIVILLLLIFPAVLSAQTSTSGRISGTLIDATSKAPVGFANVVLLTATDSSLVTGATSDIEGKFLMERVPTGRFMLRVSMVGYPTKYVPNITVTATSPTVALGNISLKPAATQLSEVQIVTERELVQYDLDKKVVNVSKDIAAQSGSVAEVMQNLPSVNVDIDGNVSMRGSENVTILIDGKRSALSNLTLDQIPANLIESIELITNPSSKYNPEGTSGIINLVMKKENKPGFHGSASVTAGTYDNYNTSLNLNYRYFKWSLNGGYDYRQRTRPGENESFTTNFHLDEQGRLDSTSYRQQYGERNSTDISHNFRLGADYFVTPKITVSASALYRFGQDEGDSYNRYTFLDENRDLRDVRLRYTDDLEDEKALDLTLGYRQTFTKKGQELTADIVYNTNVDDEISNYREFSQLNSGIPELQRSLVDDGNYEFVANADYMHPLSENSNLEAGFRSTFERLDEDSRFFSQNGTTDQLLLDPKQSNHFVYDETVHAVYANYNNKFRSISYQIGLRAEQTLTTADQRADSPDTNYEPIDNNYFSLFPTLFITNDFDDNNKVQFSYSRRINRPRSRFLNPFEDRSDIYNVRYGNPALRPEFVNSLELGYLRYMGDASFNGTVFYRHTTDEIERFRTATTITITETDENGNIVEREVPANRITFLNLASNTAYGIELGVNYPVTSWWRLNASWSGFQTEVNTTQNDTELSSSRVSWNSKLNSSMTVWKDMDIQLSASYRSPMADIQGRMEQMFSADLGVKKDVLKKNGTITLRVSDLFNTRQFNFLSYGDTFRTESENRRQSRIVYLGFTYRLNSDNDTQRNRRQNNENGGDSEEDF
ncbi:TonB-dependent receptor [Pontibacter sp. Tf4]|uniref:TonB-dependent receptor domain-containing protein n=1 Tax=Pontibacter sp. Tf4 TaxID=2761620 RepID=UPI001626E5F1|nr:TonB-dependent receptor [Pontibacter sp. Tf4]MBB6609938.1 TonB-dependent receptor [Pontibacter sp. Tf4]